jgi:heme-degrading monooxygenase HmoA
MTFEGKTRSVLLLQPRNGDYDALIAWFRRNDILGLAIRAAGCLAAEFQVPVSRTGPVLVTAYWDSPEAYAVWQTHPVRDQFSGQIEELTEPGPPPISNGLYTVAISA